VVNAARAKRLLINCTQGTVLRLLPAMTATRAELDKAVTILEEVLMDYAKSLASKEESCRATS
jgi:acetylornithine/succinyldiaminopimelate/putrescine aminotransferase